jgi:hypothetical protein
MSSKKLDAAIDALVDALAELPDHELEGWQHNRLGLRILCELGRRYPGIVQDDEAGSPQVGVSRAAAFLDHAGRAAFGFLRRARNVTMPKPAANSGSAAGRGTGFTIAESIRKPTLAVKPAPD